MSQPSALLHDIEPVHNIRYIRLTWVDYTCKIRYRIIPIAHFKRMLASPRPSIGLPKTILGLVLGVARAVGFSSVGEYLYVPDMLSLRLSGYEKGTATVMGWFQEKVPHPIHGLAVPLCPRTILKRVVADAHNNMVEFLVGFETEFILLQSTEPYLIAANNYGFNDSDALPSGGIETIVLEEIASALAYGGVELQMYHSEAAPGQYEIVTGPLRPLEAADALIFTRETIKNIASKHKLRATLAPRVYANNFGSAAHAHISVHSLAPAGPSDPAAATDPNPILTDLQASWLSGLLSHLPAIQLLTMPLPASYLRMQDGVLSGGTYVSWGTENREAPIRLCNASSSTARNFEVRCLDGLANPYMALAGIIGAGMSGTNSGARLTMRDCGDVCAAELSEEERRKLGITQRMALTWDEARMHFERDEVLEEVFGEEVHGKYLNVNQTWQIATDKKDKDASLRFLVEHY